MTSEMLSGTNFWAGLLLQGTGCIAAGLALSYLPGRRAARAHQVLLVAMLASVLMPASSLLVRHFELGLLASPAPAPVMTSDLQGSASFAEAGQIAANNPSTEELAYDSSAADVAAPALAPAASEPVATSIRWDVVFLVCWAAATALLLGRLILRFVLGLRLLGRSRPLTEERFARAAEAARARLGIVQPVHVRTSRNVRSPVIWCWARCPILLVQDAARHQKGRMDWAGVFCHELAHWKRRDHASGFLAELLSTALPWHPLLWWARHRLLTLSENACDDWAVAGGPAAVEYAESLLDLSPENQLAFLPTVVGKEKAMKERICRILKERCDDPRIGTRWMLGVSVVAVLATVGVAFAQRRPARPESPEARQRAELRQRDQVEKRELALVGRRNVLSRLLEQLTAQARETEAALRERGDEPGEEGHILRAELDALHRQIELVERQLQGLGREPQRGEREESARRRPREAERAGELADLMRHRQELQERARARQRELEGLGDNQDERARDVEAELREIRENIGRVEQEMAAAQERRARAERDRAMELRERARREAERAAQEALRVREAAGAEAEHARELAQRLRELQNRSDEARHRLGELGNQDSDEARELRGHIERMHAEMDDIEKALQQIRRQRAEVTRRGREVAEPRLQELEQRREELRRNIEQMERELRERGQEETDETREMRVALRRMHAELQQAEAAGRAAREARTEARAARSGRAAAQGRPVRETEEQTVVRLFKLEHANPAQMAKIVQSTIGRLGKVIPDERTDSLLVTAPPDEQARIEDIIRKLDVPGEGPPREKAKPDQALEMQVKELQGKVDGMHEEMQQMREMLQRLLKRSESPSTEPQERKER